jgi:hypothetical protein
LKTPVRGTDRVKRRRPEGIRSTDPARVGAPGGDQFKAAVAIVCEGYCAYFKGLGGEKECGGFSAVLQGLFTGAIPISHLERVAGREPGPPERRKVMMESLCASCGYLADGCDFQSVTPPEGSTPCGGYRLLQALLEIGALSENDLDGLVRKSPLARIRKPAERDGV